MHASRKVAARRGVLIVQIIACRKQAFYTNDPGSLIASEPWLDPQCFNESEMALFLECMPECARKGLDTADIQRGDVSTVV